MMNIEQRNRYAKDQQAKKPAKDLIKLESSARTVVFPCSNKDALKHFSDTIASPVPYEKLVAHMDPMQRDAFDAVYGPEDEIRLWGCKDNQVNQVSKLDLGTQVVFASKGVFIATGRISLILRNPTIAQELWGTGVGHGSSVNDSTWPYLIFLAEVNTCNALTKGYADKTEGLYTGIFQRMTVLEGGFATRMIDYTQAPDSEYEAPVNKRKRTVRDALDESIRGVSRVVEETPNEIVVEEAVLDSDDNVVDRVTKRLPKHGARRAYDILNMAADYLLFCHRHKHAQESLFRSRIGGIADLYDDIFWAGQTERSTTALETRREHVIPVKVLFERAMELCEQGAKAYQLRDFLRTHLVIVDVSKAEQEAMDVSWRQKMPDGWKWGDSIYARLERVGAVVL